jgi:hypothetical protein
MPVHRERTYVEFGRITVQNQPDEVFWHVNTGGALVRIAADPDGVFRSRVFPGLWLDPAAVSAGDLDALITAIDRGLASPEHAAFVARLAAARPAAGAE